jgi:hypothetical protein
MARRNGSGAGTTLRIDAPAGSPGPAGGLSGSTRWRIRKRHRGYAYLLIAVSLAVLVQPLALNWPLLTSLNSIIMAMVMMVFLTKNSDLRSQKCWLYGLGTSAIIFEVVWLACMVHLPALANHLTLIHLLLWALGLIAAEAPSGEPMADTERLVSWIASGLLHLDDPERLHRRASSPKATDCSVFKGRRELPPQWFRLLERELDGQQCGLGLALAKRNGGNGRSAGFSCSSRHSRGRL